MKEILKKFLHINIVLLIVSFFTQVFSNKAQFINIEGVMNPRYLYIENYVLMTFTVVTAIYLLIYLIRIYLKSKSLYIIVLLISNLFLLLVLAPFVVDQTTYDDFVGLHIDKFIGLLFMLVAILNLFSIGTRFILNRKSP